MPFDPAKLEAVKQASGFDPSALEQAKAPTSAPEQSYYQRELAHIREPKTHEGPLQNPTGVGGTAGALLPEIAGAVYPPARALGPLVKFATSVLGSGVGQGAEAALKGQDPTGPMLGTAGTTAVLGALSPAVQWMGGRLADKFQAQKYVGGIARKLSDHFAGVHDPIGPDSPWRKAFGSGDEMKTQGDLYKMLHYDKNKPFYSSRLGDVTHETYDRSAKEITAALGDGAKITGDAAKGLNSILVDVLPQFKKAKAAATKGIPGGANESLHKLVEDQYLGKPMGVGEAMDLARDLTKEGYRTNDGGIKKLAQDFKSQLAVAIDNLGVAAGEPGMGAKYSMLNRDYRKRMEIMRSFDAAELFPEGKGTGPSGASFDRVKWQKASDNAEKTLKDVQAGDIDEFLRKGQPPGHTGAKKELHIRAYPKGLGGLGHVGGMLPNIGIESPLRPVGDKTNIVIDRVMRALGGYFGGRGSEAASEDQTGR